MPVHAPNKTTLGHAELRHRSHALGQRHRTILLLVDGHRPLSEVLALAHKAGAQTTHFEDLVRLGLVDMPSEPIALDPVITSPGVLEVPVVSVEPEPDTPALPVGIVIEEGAPQGDAQQPPLAGTPHDAPGDDARGDVPGTDAAGRVAPAADVPDGRRMALPRVARRARAAQLGVQPSSALTPVSKPKGRVPRAAPAPQRSAARALAAGAPSDPVEKALLQQVRDLLVDTLRLDAPLFGARMLMRVRGAQSPGALIDLAWEIESHLSHTRRSRGELLSLQRARELLGLGNTLVADDSATVRDSELPLSP